jgi:hypothetical protein
MNRTTLSADVAAFLARGGAIQTVAIGERSDVVERIIAEQRALERALAFDYTAYSMNRGEGANHVDAINFASKGV